MFPCVQELVPGQVGTDGWLDEEQRTLPSMFLVTALRGTVSAVG